MEFPLKIPPQTIEPLILRDFPLNVEEIEQTFDLPDRILLYQLVEEEMALLGLAKQCKVHCHLHPPIQALHRPLLEAVHVLLCEVEALGVGGGVLVDPVGNNSLEVEVEYAA